MSAVVELEGVARQYLGPPITMALKRCDLVVNEGDFVAIMGPSGSGKSTLLNIIGLLDTPSQGTYRLRGTDVSDLRENRRAALRGLHIGFVFQSFHLMAERTCLENVMLADLYTGGSMDLSREAAREALNEVGLEGKADRVPSELSGGEQQRVAIARAIAGKPSLLLCDEPTGNLDQANAEAVMRIFSKLSDEGATIVLITHDPKIAKSAGRLVRILDGVVSEPNRMMT